MDIEVIKPAQKANQFPLYKDTPIGTIGFVRNSTVPHYNGVLVMKLYGQRATGLESPESYSWNGDPGFQIEPLPEGTKVVITV